MDEITGTDAIRAASIIQGYVAQFKRHYTKNEVDSMVLLAIRLNNYGVGRPD